MKYPTNITRISGYRVRFLTPDQQRYQWSRVNQDAKRFAGAAITAARQEPFFIDDAFQSLTNEQLISETLSNGELFVCSINGYVFGIATLYDIFHERHATLDAWSIPTFRNFRGNQVMAQAAKEIIEYAFKPFAADGLGLIKLKASVAAANYPAIRACEALGFKFCGREIMGALHHGQPGDTLNFEKLNPRIFLPTAESLSHEKIESTGSPDVHSASALPSTGALPGTAGPASGNPESLNAAGSDEPGRGSRGEATGMATIEQRSDEPGGPIGIRSELSEALPQSATGGVGEPTL